MSSSSQQPIAALKKLLNIEFLRFLLVGALNTGVGYLVYLLGLLVANLSPGVALAVATVIGALFNFVTTGRMVFRDSAWSRLPLFLLSYAMVYVLNLCALQGLIAIGVPAHWAQAILLPVMAVTSYAVFRTMVFKKPGRSEE